MNIIPEFDFALQKDDLKILIPVLSGFIAYLVYYFVKESEHVKKKLTARYGKEKASAVRIISSKLLGGFLLGIFPMGIYMMVFRGVSPGDMGWTWPKDFHFTVWATIVSVLIVVPLVYIFGKQSSVIEKQPEIRMKQWSMPLLLLLLFAWTIYLLGYEFFFRGVLLFPLVEQWGIWPAIAVNVLFYAGVHLPGGVGEAVGALIISVILSLLTIISGTIWIAFLVHVAMAWTVTLSALKHHPEMTIERRDPS